MFQLANRLFDSAGPQTFSNVDQKQYKNKYTQTDDLYDSETVLHVAIELHLSVNFCGGSWVVIKHTHTGRKLTTIAVI